MRVFIMSLQQPHKPWAPMVEQTAAEQHSTQARRQPRPMHETACDTLPQGNKQQYRPTTASNAKLPDSFGLDRPATAKGTHVWARKHTAFWAGTAAPTSRSCHRWAAAGLVQHTTVSLLLVCPERCHQPWVSLQTAVVARRMTLSSFKLRWRPIGSFSTG